MPRWSKPDDAKLALLFRTPRNGVNPKDLSVAAVEAVHKKCFPDKNCNDFAPLHRAKARDFSVGVSSEGHRSREFFVSTLNAVVLHCLTCLPFTGSRAAKAAAAGEEDEDSEDDKDCDDEEEEDI